ncbi:MAG: HNH endonuclease [Actinomycetota bacterium]
MRLQSYSSSVSSFAPEEAEPRTGCDQRNQQRRRRIHPCRVERRSEGGSKDGDHGESRAGCRQPAIGQKCPASYETRDRSLPPSERAENDDRHRGDRDTEGRRARLRPDRVARAHPRRPGGEPATEVDHITPQRIGGTNDRANLQALCHRCHSRKTALENGFGGVG